jgi:hypothetical protein
VRSSGRSEALFVYSVEVAPLGSTEWTATGRKVGMLAGLWGIARTSDLWFPGMPQWDESEGCMRFDQAAFRAHLAELGVHLRVPPSWFYQRMRAQLCGLYNWLALTIANGVYRTEAIV